MAKAPMTADAPPMADEEDDASAAAPAASDDAAAAGDDADAGDDHQVLLTVCKEADGTYSLIQGDEEEADDAGAGGAEGASPAEDADASENKQNFDSIGALLKGVLDILKADASSEGGEGSADDQFQAGFDESKPAAPAAQKY